MLIRYRSQAFNRELKNSIKGIDLVQNILPDSMDHILIMSVDGSPQSLNSTILPEARVVDFFDIHSAAGANAMAISATAIMLCAAESLFPDVTIAVEHSYSRGFFCKPLSTELLPDDYILKISSKMSSIIDMDIEMEERTMSISEIQEIPLGRFKILKKAPFESVQVYDICGFPHWFLSPLIPRTSYLNHYRLQSYADGFVLQFPNSMYPNSLPPFLESPKLFSIFQESEHRGQLLGIKFTDHLNERIEKGDFVDAIHLYEALHEKKIAQIADAITFKHDHVRFIFVAGPSSSGKTTFMKRLSIQLRINGLHVKNISLDDYYIDRDKIMPDENGNIDFEHLNMIDHALLNENLNDLMLGKKVVLPHFNFHTGRRELAKTFTTLGPEDVLIIEGIHGLNPELTKDLDPESVFKIYISALTQLNFNVYNRISTADTRLLRRMLRDYQFRSYSVENTLKRWPLVRMGEERWIFPYQEHADMMFNSALEYEWAVFRERLLPLLDKIPVESEVKAEAVRISRYLQLFLPLPPDDIPPTSILREFIGGSSLHK
ncbi:uridine kinase [Fidelibacter multiformis]|jgi:uridine kinase|uniref:uridine kinase family protein n=1 Tax=Fidelibacter multiformis TaxID=3377529 RepID=UPI0037DBF266